MVDVQKALAAIEALPEADKEVQIYLNVQETVQSETQSEESAE